MNSVMLASFIILICYPANLEGNSKIIIKKINWIIESLNDAFPTRPSYDMINDTPVPVRFTGVFETGLCTLYGQSLAVGQSKTTYYSPTCKGSPITFTAYTLDAFTQGSKTFPKGTKCVSKDVTPQCTAGVCKPSSFSIVTAPNGC